MGGDEPELVRARRAALLLHSLPPAARRRAMSKLSTAEAAILAPLLQELTDLGVSASIGQQLRELISSAPAVPPAAQKHALTLHERVASLSAEGVARAFKSCAPVTAAELLRAGEWPWTQQVLNQLSELRRTEVLRHMRDAAPALAPAALNCLCERLCREAGRQEAGNTADAKPDGPHLRRSGTIKARLRRLTAWMR
jgi:hypothetical protein